MLQTDLALLRVDVLDGDWDHPYTREEAVYPASWTREHKFWPAVKRADKIRKALPDGLDLMVICAEAGLSLDATLMRVSQEMESTAPELADEFSLTGLELGFLPDRRKALQNLMLRVDLPGVRGVVNTLLQAERYGTPLAQSLRVMSADSRNERIMKAKEKAARLPAVLTVPMVVFILPPLFIILIGRAILNTIDALSGVKVF